MTLTEEMALANKLISLEENLHLFEGLTSFEERREKARVAVKRCWDVTFTIRDGKVITMKQMFERAYQCDL